MTLVVAVLLLMFGLDPKTGKLKIEDKEKHKHHKHGPEEDNTHSHGHGCLTQIMDPYGQS